MENLNIIHYVKGRKVRRGYIDSIGGISFAIFPAKADRCIYFAIPGAGEREDAVFLQCYAEDWDKDVPVEEAIAKGVAALEKTNPETWVEDFSAKTLQDARDNKRKWHREYLLALLDEHEAFKGVKWKPNE